MRNSNLLIVATANEKKYKEIKAILKGLPLRIKSLLDFEEKPEIVEDGKTFYENAKKKAQTVSLFYNGLALGEDSGLEVKALGGRPGVFSSRFAGENSSDKKNISKLLKELGSLPLSERKAKFVSWVVLAYKGKVLKSFGGSLSGVITYEPQGGFGFGYDPVFFLPKYKKTVAQIRPSLKNRISHRYKALAKLKEFLEGYLKNKSFGR